MQKTQTSINTQGFNQVANLMLQFRLYVFFNKLKYIC